jgi:hypothetical protein
MKTFNLGDTVKLLEDSPFIKAGTVGRILDLRDGDWMRTCEYTGIVSVSVNFGDSDCLLSKDFKEMFETDRDFQTQYIKIDNLELVEKYDDIRRH